MATRSSYLHAFNLCSCLLHTAVSTFLKAQDKVHNQEFTAQQAISKATLLADL